MKASQRQFEIVGQLKDRAEITDCFQLDYFKILEWLNLYYGVLGVGTI